MNPNDIPSTVSFCGFQKECTTSSTIPGQHIISNRVRGVLVQHMVAANVISNAINVVSDNTDIADNMNSNAQDPLHTENVMNILESGTHFEIIMYLFLYKMIFGI